MTQDTQAFLIWYTISAKNDHSIKDTNGAVIIRAPKFIQTDNARTIKPMAAIPPKKAAKNLLVLVQRDLIRYFVFAGMESILTYHKFNDDHYGKAQQQINLGRLKNRCEKQYQGGDNGPDHKARQERIGHPNFIGKHKNPDGRTYEGQASGEPWPRFKKEGKSTFFIVHPF